MFCAAGLSFMWIQFIEISGLYLVNICPKERFCAPIQFSVLWDPAHHLHETKLCKMSLFKNRLIKFDCFGAFWTMWMIKNNFAWNSEY